MQVQMRASTNSKGQRLLNANVMVVMVIEVCWSVLVELVVVVAMIAKKFKMWIDAQNLTTFCSTTSHTCLTEFN